MDIKIEEQARGTRLLIGETAKKRRTVINTLVELASNNKHDEILLPLIEPASIYTEKMGKEILNQMFVFNDKGDRELCLRPEGTATCQLLAKQTFKQQKDIKLFYVTNCWRYERPQLGRYRGFTQFGIEILNPTINYTEWLTELAKIMVGSFTKEFTVNSSAKRGLAYYSGDGFEISCDKLGAQKQVCGGGTYDVGIGFALGIDRLMLL